MSVEQNTIDQHLWQLIITIGPHVVWALVLMTLLAWIGPKTIRQFFERIDGVTLGAVQLSFRSALESVAAAKNLKLSFEGIGSASRRLSDDLKYIKDAKILWVDDRPRNNFQEAKILKAAGIRIKFATDTAAAVRLLNGEDFDLVISDIGRDKVEDSGLHLLEPLFQLLSPPPIIFYVGSVSYPPPKGAFGITEYPDELIHLVLDALARRLDT
jgi:hypothetical protein